MKKLNHLAVVVIVTGLQCNLAVAADPVVQTLEAKSEILHLIRREKLDVVLPRRHARQRRGHVDQRHPFR